MSNSLIPEGGGKPPEYKGSDFWPIIKIYLFIIPSWIFNFFDNTKVEWTLKTILLFYVFAPLFLFYIDYEFLGSSYFISNYYYSIIYKHNYDMLTTLYLIVPLINLFFQEHTLIMNSFVSHYSENKDINSTASLLDFNKDEYDKSTTYERMKVIFANQRSLSKYKVVEKYLYWVSLVGEKRRNMTKYTSSKILMIILLLILGMPMSLSEHTSLYYFMSLSIFIFIILIIFTQITYSLRTILKTILLKGATDGADYYYSFREKPDPEPKK